MIMPLIVFIYMAAMIFLGWYFSKRVKNVTDFLLAGRNVGPMRIALTVAVSVWGAGAIVGGIEVGAQWGAWPGALYTFANAFGILALIFFMGKFRKLRLFTIPEHLFKRYNSEFLRGLASITYLLAIIGVLAAQLTAAGWIFETFGFPYVVGGVIFFMVILIYSFASGLYGIINTDVWQFWVGIVGLLAVTFFFMGEVPGGAASLLSTSFVPAGFENTAVWLVVPVFVSVLIGVDWYQRIQAAKDLKTARLGFGVGALILFLIAIPIGLLGAGGHVLYPGAGAADVLMNLVAACPALVGALFLATLLAAIMSSADTLLGAGCNVAIIDIYHHYFHPKEDIDKIKGSLRVSRLTIVIMGILVLILGLAAPSVIGWIIAPITIYSAAIFVPFIGGLVWKGATKAGAVTASSVGTLLAVLSITGVVSFPIEVAVFSLLVSGIVFVIVSFLTKEHSLST